MTERDIQQTARPAGLNGGQRLRFVARDAAFYGVMGIVSKAFVLATLPLLTRYFGVEVYGSIDFLLVAALFLTATAILGLDSAMARLFWDDDDPSRRRQVVSQSLILQFGTATAVAIALLLVGDRISLPIEPFPDLDMAILLVALHVPVMTVFSYSQNVLKWSFARSRLAFVTVGQAATNAALLTAAVLWLGADVITVLAISLTSRAVFALVGLTYCRPWLTFPLGTSYVKALYAFGVPFGIIATIGTAIPVLERTAVGALLGPEDLSRYAAGATVALIITLPIQAFQMAWGPFAFAIYRDAGAARTYNQVLRGFTLVCCIAVVWLVAVAPFALALIGGPEYVAGAVVVLPLAAGQAIQGIGWVSEIGITLSKNTNLQLPAYAAFLTVSAACITLFGRPFGIIGIAGAVLVGYAVKAIVASALAQRAHPLAWSFAPIALLIIATGVTAFAVGAIGAVAPATVSVTAAAIGSAILFVVAWVGVLVPDERDRIRQALMSFGNHR